MHPIRRKSSGFQSSRGLRSSSSFDRLLSFAPARLEDSSLLLLENSFRILLQARGGAVFFDLSATIAKRFLKTYFRIVEISVH